MKIVTGLSALLLGTTLLAGASYAQNNNNNNGYTNPPPVWHGEGGAGRPHDNHAPPQGGGRNYPNFAGQHANQNQARWNHVVTYHDRNVAHFNAQDRAMWTHGQWRHTRHNGRNGWWWYTNGAWFFYDEPVYPYPDTVSDDYSFDDDYADTPAPGGYVWYYCNNPPGYYPYVQQCSTGWRAVPAQPSQQ